MTNEALSAGPVAWQYRWHEANWVPGAWSDWAFMTKDPTGSIQQHDYQVRPLYTFRPEVEAEVERQRKFNRDLVEAMDRAREERGHAYTRAAAAEAELIDKREAVDRLTEAARAAIAVTQCYSDEQQIIRAQLKAAEAQLAKMREALEPFANFVPDFFDDGYQDDDIVKLESHHGNLDLTLTVADFRRARTALGADHAPD